MKIQIKTFVKKLLAFSPRQFEGEKRTADFLLATLEKGGFPFVVQSYEADLPVFRGKLFCDRKKIPVQAVGLKSGKIVKKDVIISSLLSTSVTGNVANLNFNPCSEALSCANHYNAPALSVAKSNLTAILKAKEIRGEAQVKAKNHHARNILVGNSRNPQKIFFAHYDSILKGAIDNASGVASMLAAIFSTKANLERVLYVFAANEELSFDWPFYWGRGYREFEKHYPVLLKKAKKIFVIDCVGNGVPSVIDDPNMILRAFPLANVKRLNKKIGIITGDYDHLMTVYHSDADDGRGISEKFLHMAQDMIIKEAQNES